MKTFEDVREQFDAALAKDLTTNEVKIIFEAAKTFAGISDAERAEIIGRILRHPSFARLAEEAKADWIAKGMTKEEVNAAARM